MKKTLKRLCTGFLALATVVTALPTTPVHAESKQYWTESKERVGIVEKVMNDGSIGSTFNEGHLTVEGEDAYCIDINTDFRNGYKTRADASTRMSADQISDVALSIEYVKQYTDSHSGISNNHAYLLRQLVVWQRLSVHLGWQCDNVRASYDEIPKATQDEVFSGARAFIKENKGRYECGGYIYSGEGQELGQFWAKLNVGNAKLKKTSSNGLTLSPYNFITILIATGVCALVAFLYYRFCYDSFKKLLHRQKLARMILENKWYEADTVQDSGFFTDLQSRSREKIVWFPKIYYQMEKGLLHIRCEITLGKYQDQLLRLEDKLESGLYCELTDKTLHDGYIEYTLLYDMIANRITIDEVRAENGSLKLMNNLVWEYDALPHALIAGGTGGGKTYFLLTLIEALLHTNAGIKRTYQRSTYQNDFRF